VSYFTVFVSDPCSRAPSLCLHHTHPRHRSAWPHFLALCISPGTADELGSFRSTSHQNRDSHTLLLIQRLRITHSYQTMKTSKGKTRKIVPAYATKAYRGRRRKAPFIFKPSTRRRWAVGFTARHFTPRKDPGTHLT